MQLCSLLLIIVYVAARS